MVIVRVAVPVIAKLAFGPDRVGKAFIIVVIVKSGVRVVIFLIIVRVIRLRVIIVIVLIAVQILAIQVVLKLILVVLSVLSSFLCQAALEVKIGIGTIFLVLSDRHCLEFRLIVRVLSRALGILVSEDLLMLHPASFHLLEDCVFFLFGRFRGRRLLFWILCGFRCGRKRLIGWVLLSLLPLSQHLLMVDRVKQSLVLEGLGNGAPLLSTLALLLSFESLLFLCLLELLFVFLRHSGWLMGSWGEGLVVRVLLLFLQHLTLFGLELLFHVLHHIVRGTFL